MPRNSTSTIYTLTNNVDLVHYKVIFQQTPFQKSKSSQLGRRVWRARIRKESQQVIIVFLLDRLGGCTCTYFLSSKYQQYYLVVFCSSISIITCICWCFDYHIISLLLVFFLPYVVYRFPFRVPCFKMPFFSSRGSFGNTLSFSTRQGLGLSTLYPLQP